MQKIVLASGNRGKLKEFQQLFTGIPFELVTQADFEVPEIEESGLSFVENAILKARNAAHHTGLPALADDSGLEVDALQGHPGIFSARYAGSTASDADNNQKLLAELSAVDDPFRTARFQCLLVAVRYASDPTPLICQGSWLGSILREPAGNNGFGYDPLFFVPDRQCSSAQLDPKTKNSISHRGQAIAQLLHQLKQPKYQNYFSLQ